MTQAPTVTNDITTRLLAQENILIERAPVRTASFDVKHRILTLPQWKNMTTEIEEMLKAHEVGHALYTDESMFVKFRESNVPFAYYNIIEDVRIERLMKEKFPGLRRVFTNAYKSLVDMDFFGTSTKDVNTMAFADRINLYFKAGFNCGVRFSAAEKFIVDQISRVDSIAQVDVLARKVYEFSKKQAQDKRDQMMNDKDMKKLFIETEREKDELDELDALDAHDDDDYDDGLDDVDFEEKEEEKETKQERGGTGSAGGTTDENIQKDQDAKEVEKSILPTTNTAFEDRVADLADTSTEYNYLTLPNFGAHYEEFIIPYKQILRDNFNAAEQRKLYWIARGHDLRAENVDNLSRETLAEYEKFQFETSKVVSYLVKEFEMKKAATDYKRIHVAKTGVLDPRKLASYKIREDLFKQIAITKDGQKHGMIFVLDWSGSMSDYLTETVKQLISLVQFCHRTQIPFQVFAFTDRRELQADDVSLANEYNGGTYNRRDALESRIFKAGQGNLLGVSAKFSMLEFFNHTMKPSELKNMCKTLFLMAKGICSDEYQLNGTPLNEALVFMYDYVGRFMSKNQVEKFTMIKLTDGDGGSCHGYSCTDREDYSHNYYDTHNMTDRRYLNGSWTKQVYFVRDTISKKNYQLDLENVVWGNLLTQMIRDRYNCGTIGFHVTKSSGRDIGYALRTYGSSLAAVDVVAVKRDMLKEQFAGISVYGHDELFLLRANMKISEEELAKDMADMTAAAIAKNFSKHLSAKKTSRVLLNRFVKVVA